MDYEPKFFSPPAEALAADGVPAGVGTGGVYVYSDAIVLAVNVALATGRPLLVAGPPGSGKSTLARSVAGIKGWRYLEKVVTSAA
jgi:MoxR-like ATPase